MVISIRARDSYNAREPKSDTGGMWKRKARTITLTARHSIVFATKTSSGSTPTTTKRRRFWFSSRWMPTEDGRPVESLAAWHGERSARLFGKGKSSSSFAVALAAGGKPSGPNPSSLFSGDADQRLARAVGDWSFRVPEAQRTEDLIPDRPNVRSPRNGSGRFFWRGRAERASRGASTPARPGGATAEGICLGSRPRSPRIRAEDSASIRKHEPKGQIRVFFALDLPGGRLIKSKTARPPEPRAPVSSKKASRRDRESSPCCLALSLSLSFHSQRPRLFADSVQKAS
jgi:hypothetical protein